MNLNHFTLVLAQDSAADRPVSPVDTTNTSTVETTGADGSQTPVNGSNTGNGAGQNPLGLWIWLLPLALILIMVSSGGRKEKKKHAQMMAALAKGDKVRTIGGILGTVVDLRDDEIVVKVDENANTRLRFSRNAIQAIVESKSSD